MHKNYSVFKNSWILLMLLISSFSFAQKIWTGATDTNWNTASNWNTNSVPVATDNVVIPNTTKKPVVSANNTCASITFTGAAQTLTVNSGFSLTVTRAVTLNSIVNSDSESIISGGGTLNATTVNVGNNISSNANNTVNLISRIFRFNIKEDIIVYSNYNRTGVLFNYKYFYNNAIFSLEDGLTNVDGQIKTINENTVNESTFSMVSGTQSGTLLLGNADPFNLATGKSTINFNGTNATVTYDAIIPIPITGTPSYQNIYSTIYRNLTTAGTGYKLMAGAITINKDLFVGSDTWLIDNDKQITGNLDGLLTIETKGHLQLGGNDDKLKIPATQFPTLYKTSNINLQTGSEVRYNYNGQNGGSQLISTVPTYDFLHCQFPGTKLVGNGTLTINGDFDTASPLNLGSATVKVKGSFNLLTVPGAITLTSSTLSIEKNFNNNLITGGSINTNKGKVVFNGDSSQFINGNGYIPTFFYNLEIDNSTGVSVTITADKFKEYDLPVPAKLDVTVTNQLTMNNGILATTTTNLLNVTNSATIAISGGSATAFINGPVKWTTPLNSNYTFPVGKGTTYLPFVLKTSGNVATPSQVEAFDANSGGSPIFSASATTLGNLSDTEYWSLTTTGTFTNSTISLSRPSDILPFDAIGGSVTKTGDYSSLGGTVGPNGITNSTAIGTNRFFTFGQKNGIRTGVIGGSPFCAGSTIIVPYTITGNFNGGNVFTAQLSDASGSFASPTTLATLSQAVGNITATIPANAIAGNAYRIRVVSTNPKVLGKDNGTNLTVNASTVITSQPVSATYCQNSTAAGLSVAAAGSGTLTYEWFRNTTNTTTGGVSVGTGTSYTPLTTTAGTLYYYVKVTGTCGTVSSTIATITVNSAPIISTQPNSTAAYCLDSPATALSVTANGTGTLTYEWFRNSVNNTTGGVSVATGTSFTPQTNAAGTFYYYVKVTGSCGTVPSTVTKVTVNPSLTFGTLTATEVSACGNGTSTISATGLIPNSTGTYFYKTSLTGNTEISISVVADANGNGSFTTAFLPSSYDGVTITVTKGTLNGCTTLFSGNKTVTLLVGKTTTLGTAGWNNGIPRIIDKAVIAENYSTAQDIIACTITVNAGKVLTIGSGKSATIQNDIINNGNIVVESDGNLIQKNDNATYTGNNITVKRDSKMKRLEYIYWGTPVDGQVLRTFSPKTVASRFYSYNEIDDTFSIITTLNNPMVKGQGYVIRAPNDFTTALQSWTGIFTGKPTNGIVNVAVAKSVTGAGKNLVGNPYPSNISLDQLTADNPATANGVYYFWTNINDFSNSNNTTPNGSNGNYNANNYAVYSGTGGTPATGSSLKPSGIIKPGQGFLYEAKAGGTLKFTNNVRTKEVVDKWNINSTFISNKTGGLPTPPSAERYWLKLTNPAGNFNTVLLGYIEGATNSYEPRFDAKFPVASSDRFYSISDGNDLIIQGRQYPFVDTDVVPLGMTAFETGTYTISLSEKEGIFENGQNIYLKDKQTGIVTNLSEGSYSYLCNAGENTSRFEIIYESDLVLATDGSAKDDLQVYRDGTEFVVKSRSKKITDLEMYDTSGRLVLKSTPNHTETRVEGKYMINGMYILKINRNGEFTSKKIIK